MASDYRVCETPVEALSDDEILAEARELRQRITRVRSSIAERRQWAVANRETSSAEFTEWMARITTRRSKLECRYAEIRPREKDINISRRNK